MKLLTRIKHAILVAAVLIGLMPSLVQAETATVNGVKYEYNERWDGGEGVELYLPSTVKGALVIPSEIDGYTVTKIVGCVAVYIDDNGIVYEGVASGPKGMTSVTIPETVEIIEASAFYGCTGLKSVTILGATTIGGGAFVGCTSLSKVTLSDGVYIEDGEYNPFAGTKVEEFVVTDDGYGSIMVEDGVLFIEEEDEKRLVAYPSGKRGGYTLPSSVTEIGNGAFGGCTKLTSFTVTADNVDVYFTEGAFEDCSNLATVTLPDCLYLLSNPFGGAGVTKFVVTETEWVTKIVLKDGVLVSADGETLIACPIGKSGSYTIPSGVKAIGDYAFCGCAKLTSVTIPDTVTKIGDWAFEDCTKLASVTIPDTVTKIGDGAFDGCKALKSVVISEYVEIGAHAFSSTGLTSIEIPEGVSLGNYAFVGCTSLTSVTIDGDVGLGYSIFAGCTKLKQILVTDDFSGEFVNWNGDEDLPKGCTVYVVPTIEVDDVEDYYAVGESVTLYAYVSDEDYTLKATGLPKGMTAAYANGVLTMSGAPSAAAFCTVTITATKTKSPSVTKKIEMNVGMRKLSLAVPSAMGGVKTLTGAGYYAAGKTAALKATAEKGYVFAGWYLDEGGTNACSDLGVDYRTANVSYKMPDNDVELYATFATTEQDAAELSSYVDGVALDGEAFVIEDEVEMYVSVSSITVPTVKVAGLPKGLTFDAKKLVITGTPTVPGVYTVTVTLSNTSIKNKTEKFTITVPNLDSGYIYGLNDAKDEPYNFIIGSSAECVDLFVEAEDGYTLKVSGLPSGLKYYSDKRSNGGIISGSPTKIGTYTVTFTATKGKDVQTSTRTFVVAALPSWLVGTYTGFIRGSSNDDNCGTFTMTATETGKITAKVVDAKGTYSFTGAWDCGSDDDFYFAEMTIYTRNGDSLTPLVVKVEVNLDTEWNVASCSGTFYDPLEDEDYDFNFKFEARKNPLADKWYMKAEADGDGFWNFTFVETAKEANLTVTPKGDGTVAIAGKIGTYSVSASSILSFDQLADGNGMFQADFVTFATVNREKKALSISCELWFNHPAGDYAGFATLVE